MKRLFFIFLFIALSHSNTLADGCFVWHNKNIDITEPQQKAFIVFDQGREDLVLEVKFEGAPEEFGWIVPLPSVPAVSKPSNSIFPLLSQITQNPYFGMSKTSRRMVQPLGFSTGLSVDIFQVGIYDVAILQNGALSELTSWLDDNDFFLKPGANEILADYIAKGWIFVAIKIRPDQMDEKTENKLASGEIQPLTFTFASEEPVFPLRISSISGQPSEILLYMFAEGGLVPQDQGNVHWETHARQNVPWGRFFKDGLFKSINERFAGRMDDIPLIKSRAVFQAHQMNDIGFRPYNPGNFLISDQLRQRTEAVTSLGTGSYPQAAKTLLDFLENSDFSTDLTFSELSKLNLRDGLAPGQDIRSAIWALGELGTQKKLTADELDRAIKTIRTWGQKSDRWTLLESLLALEILAPESAADFALEILPQMAGEDYKNSDERISRICAKLLVLHGSSKHCPKLRIIIDQYYDPKSWSQYWMMRRSNRQALFVGRIALQVSAACGDSSAYMELESQLFQMAPTGGFKWQLDNGKLHMGSYVNNYPSALAPGAAIISDSYSDDFVVADISRSVKGPINIKDSLFRSVAYSHSESHKVPDDFRAVLLGRLDNLNREDEHLLKEIWDKSLYPPQRVGLVLRQPQGEHENIEYNITALAVSYAFGVHGRVEALLDLWEQTPWHFKPEKAELALAFALTDSATALAPIMQYVRRVWGNASQDLKIQLALETDAGKRARKSRLVPFEPTYRQDRINRFLVKNGLKEVWELISEDDCPVYLKYYFLLHRYYKFQVPKEDITAALIRLKESIPSPNIQSRIDSNLNVNVRR